MALKKSVTTAHGFEAVDAYHRVEAARQAIRDKYAAMQTQIDAATTVEQLKTALSQ